MTKTKSQKARLRAAKKQGEPRKLKQAVRIVERTISQRPRGRGNTRNRGAYRGGTKRQVQVRNLLRRNIRNGERFEKIRKKGFSSSIRKDRNGQDETFVSFCGLLQINGTSINCGCTTASDGGCFATSLAVECDASQCMYCAVKQSDQKDFAEFKWLMHPTTEDGREIHQAPGAAAAINNIPITPYNLNLDLSAKISTYTRYKLVKFGYRARVTTNMFNAQAMGSCGYAINPDPMYPVWNPTVTFADMEVFSNKSTIEFNSPAVTRWVELHGDPFKIYQLRQLSQTASNSVAVEADLRECCPGTMLSASSNMPVISGGASQGYWEFYIDMVVLNEIPASAQTTMEIAQATLRARALKMGLVPKTKQSPLVDKPLSINFGALTIEKPPKIMRDKSPIRPPAETKDEDKRAKLLRDVRTRLPNQQREAWRDAFEDPFPEDLGTVDFNQLKMRLKLVGGVNPHLEVGDIIRAAVMDGRKRFKDFTPNEYAAVLPRWVDIFLARDVDSLPMVSLPVPIALMKDDGSYNLMGDASSSTYGIARTVVELFNGTGVYTQFSAFASPGLSAKVATPPDTTVAVDFTTAGAAAMAGAVTAGLTAFNTVTPTNVIVTGVGNVPITSGQLAVNVVATAGNLVPTSGDSAGCIPTSSVCVPDSAGNLTKLHSVSVDVGGVTCQAVPSVQCGVTYDFEGKNGATKVFEGVQNSSGRAFQGIGIFNPFGAGTGVGRYSAVPYASDSSTVLRTTVASIEPETLMPVHVVEVGDGVLFPMAARNAVDNAIRPLWGMPFNDADVDGLVLANAGFGQAVVKVKNTVARNWPLKTGQIQPYPSVDPYGVPTLRLLSCYTGLDPNDMEFSCLATIPAMTNTANDKLVIACQSMETFNTNVLGETTPIVTPPIPMVITAMPDQDAANFTFKYAVTRSWPETGDAADVLWYSAGSGGLGVENSVAVKTVSEKTTSESDYVVAEKPKEISPPVVSEVKKAKPQVRDLRKKRWLSIPSIEAQPQ